MVPFTPCDSWVQQTTLSRPNEIDTSTKYS
jgi:hypothetical protein